MIGLDGHLEGKDHSFLPLECLRINKRCLATHFAEALNAIVNP